MPGNGVAVNATSRVCAAAVMGAEARASTVTRAGWFLRNDCGDAAPSAGLMPMAGPKPCHHNADATKSNVERVTPPA